MTHWLVQNFGLPYGAVWPNVLAMVPCGIVAWIWGLRPLLKLHKEHAAKLDAIHQHLKEGK